MAVLEIESGAEIERCLTLRRRDLRDYQLLLTRTEWLAKDSPRRKITIKMEIRVAKENIAWLEAMKARRI